MLQPKIYIIILNWNGLTDTLECMESVFKLNYENFHVVVIDNGSIDSDSKIIKINFPQVTLIQNKENLGFTEGNNIGITYAISQKANYIWLLNNDTIVDKECLLNIVKEAELSDSIGLVSPVIYYYDSPDEIQFAGSHMNWKDITLIYKPIIEQNEIKGKSLCLWGTALLLKANMVERIGLLKKEYFAYWEDIEYSIRAIKYGYTNKICSSGKVFHKNKFHQLDNIKKSGYYHYYMNRNRMLLGREYIKNPIKKILFTIRYLASISENVKQFNNMDIDPYMNGAWHGIKGIAGPMGIKVTMPGWIKSTMVQTSKFHPLLISEILTFQLDEIIKRIQRRLSNSPAIENNAENKCHYTNI